MVKRTPALLPDRLRANRLCAGAAHRHLSYIERAAGRGGRHQRQDQHRRNPEGNSRVSSARKIVRFSSLERQWFVQQLRLARGELVFATLSLSHTRVHAKQAFNWLDRAWKRRQVNHSVAPTAFIAACPVWRSRPRQVLAPISHLHPLVARSRAYAGTYA